MSLDSAGIQNALKSHASATGKFERVLTHEPKSAPGGGLTCSFYLDSIGTVRSSGLAETSALVIWMARLQINFRSEPEDDIDVKLMGATDDMIGRYSGDLDLGGSLNIRSIDVLGMAGTPMRAEFGYVEIDGTMYRFSEITIPMIVNDVWPQVY